MGDNPSPPSYHTLSPNAVGQPRVTFPGLKASDIWFPDGARVEEGLGEERGPPSIGANPTL